MAIADAGGGAIRAPAPWRPVLSGAAAEEALGAAEELGALVREDVRDSSDPARADPTLARGAAGAALALAYLDEATGGEFGEAAQQALANAAAGVAALPLRSGLMQGFTGVAWVVAHLAGRRRDAGPGLTAPVDDALAAALERGPWRGHDDLVSGLAGIGVYALERLPSPEGRGLLELVVERLGERAEPTGTGLAWFTPPGLLPPEGRERLPGGYYNLGMAHGAPAIAAVLAGAARAGVGAAAELLDGAVAWIAGQVLPDGASSLWPYFVGPGIEPAAARLAWCYGDPGVATALLLAADSRDRDDWRALARRAVECFSARPREATGVRDASLCHGTAGMLQLCGRLHQATGDPDLAAQARGWARETLALRRSGEGLGGYSVWDADDPTEAGGVVQGPGLLAGIAGVALALAGAASAVEPAWDRCLLISLPPPPA